jgi:hypothetical protein
LSAGGLDLADCEITARFGKLSAEHDFASLDHLHMRRKLGDVLDIGFRHQNGIGDDASSSRVSPLGRRCFPFRSSPRGAPLAASRRRGGEMTAAIATKDAAGFGLLQVPEP